MTLWLCIYHCSHPSVPKITPPKLLFFEPNKNRKTKFERLRSYLIKDVKWHVSRNRLFESKMRISRSHVTNTFEQNHNFQKNLRGRASSLSNKKDEHKPVPNVNCALFWVFSDSISHFFVYLLSSTHLGPPIGFHSFHISSIDLIEHLSNDGTIFTHTL